MAGPTVPPHLDTGRALIMSMEARRLCSACSCSHSILCRICINRHPSILARTPHPCPQVQLLRIHLVAVRTCMHVPLPSSKTHTPPVPASTSAVGTTGALRQQQALHARARQTHCHRFEPETQNGLQGSAPSQLLQLQPA